MTRNFRATLTGPDAELGRIAAADFANLLLATERAVARAAGHLVNRPVKGTGRRQNVVEQAARLRLVGVQPGSVSAVLDIPEAEASPEAMPLDVAPLGEQALDAVLDIIAGGISLERMPDVAAVLVEAASRTGVGTRFDQIVFETLSPNGQPIRRVVLDERRSRQLRGSPPGPRDEERLIGLLVEADFEAYRAHLRTVGGDRISVEFSEQFADQIQEALRHQAEFVGEVQYDVTGQARSVHLREITRSEQLILGLDMDFWDTATVEDLAEQQGVEPAHGWDLYRGPSLSDDEIDAFLESLEA